MDNEDKEDKKEKEDKIDNEEKKDKDWKEKKVKEGKKDKGRKEINQWICSSMRLHRKKERRLFPQEMASCDVSSICSIFIK